MDIWEHTWRIASLCISPVQAGIIFLRTPNSSFILDLRRRSIKLCAVFLAIFLPATLVADGCFLLLGVPCALLVPSFVSVPSSSNLSSAWPRGFICMIFLERVGGGGSVKLSFAITFSLDERLRAAAIEGFFSRRGDFGEFG